MILATGPEQSLDKVRETIKLVVNHSMIFGRFHVDFDTSDEWTKTITGETSGQGIIVIHPGEFGLDGKVLAQLPLDASTSTIYDALVKSNKTFAATTKKKDYGTHFTKGRREGINFATAVPYGEDRDGKIDAGRAPQRRPNSR